MRKHCFLTTAAALLLSITAGAQSKLYPQLFDLDEVTINSGPFLHAMTLNNKVLLEYDAARLLQPYEKQAGLSRRTTASGSTAATSPSSWPTSR